MRSLLGEGDLHLGFVTHYVLAAHVHILFVDCRVSVVWNRLETLKGDRKGQHSIRINDQWRVCFLWRSGDAYDVEIVDYH